jgi:hypothetical protein
MQALLCPMVWGALKYFDLRIAERAKACGCPRCGGILDWASFPRKPRGIAGLGEERRLSLCCRVCRRRVTPASARFLWKKVYALLAVALEPVKRLIGVDRRTVGRWRQFWSRELSVQSPLVAQRRHWLPVEFNFDITSLIAVFEEKASLRINALTHLLSPLGCASWLRFRIFRAEDAR